jgi:hypothetical protein
LQRSSFLNERGDQDEQGRILVEAVYRSIGCQVQALAVDRHTADKERKGAKDRQDVTGGGCMVVLIAGAAIPVAIVLLLYRFS